MSKGGASLVVFFLVLILTAFFFFGPELFPQLSMRDSQVIRDLHVKRFMSFGNAIANAPFVEDAVISAVNIDENANLVEIITRLKRDEPELTFVYVTDANNTVLASSNPDLIGTTYKANVSAEDGFSKVMERAGIFEGAYAIKVRNTNVGFLYIGAKPRAVSAAFSTSGNPATIAAGVFVAFLAFLVTFISKRRTKARLIDDLNKRQEEIFSPKIETLKSAQNDAQKKLNEVNEALRKAEVELQQFSEEYEARKREAESNPLVQSIEKLRASESTLIKRIEELKEEESQLNKEISLLAQKREEVLAALEAEKKEERTLHEKLDLIKKKILHLETPDK
ncbi:hypothetical protein IBX73_02885 [candidate division WOR-3 bacterium]|nr:hypothetical protein [candidate division WOR-3 bacterium]